MVRINEKSGLAPSEQLMQDMGKLIEEMTRDGSLVTTAGLRPTAEGVRVRQRKSKQSVTDGPFTETKEVIGGFFLLTCETREQAIDIARECPAAQWATIEVRELGPCFA